MQFMSLVVGSTIRDCVARKSVNANYMIPLEPTEALMAQARFCDRKEPLTAYSRFLALQLWAYDVEGGYPNKFVLPVAAGDAGLDLFGAPRAFRRMRTEIVPKTLSAHGLIPRTHARIRAEVKEYFKAHRDTLRSFASFPVFAPSWSHRSLRRNSVIAVVNVQSMKTSILGVFEGNQRKLEMALSPFLHVLSYYFINMHAWAGVS
jgi:hypothetical protein